MLSILFNVIGFILYVIEAILVLSALVMVIPTAVLTAIIVLIESLANRATSTKELP